MTLGHWDPVTHYYLENFCNKASRLQTAKTAINAKSTSSLLVPNALFNELIVAAMQESEQRFFENVSVKDRKRRIPITPVILDM